MTEKDTTKEASSISKSELRDLLDDSIDFDIVEKQQKEIQKYRTALHKIAKWFGEFPDTSRFWDEEKTKPMSYCACFGSNGERDFMRKIAAEALKIV